MKHLSNENAFLGTLEDLFDGIVWNDIETYKSLPEITKRLGLFGYLFDFWCYFISYFWMGVSESPRLGEAFRLESIL